MIYDASLARVANERVSERASTHATRRIHTHTPHSESQSERARERDARREVRGMLGKRAQHMRMCILVVHVALAFGRRAKAERACVLRGERDESGCES